MLEQCGLARRRYPIRHRGRRLDTEIEYPLPGIGQQVTGTLNEHAELGLGMRRANVLEDPLPPTGVLSDLHRRRARSRTNSPNERHPATLRSARLVRETALTHRRLRR